MKFLLGIFLAVATACMAQGPPTMPSSSRWIAPSSPQIELDGLPWHSENHGDLYRLPERLMATYPKRVWDLAKDPSGARLRFRTNTTALGIRVEYDRPPDMKNMQSFGQSGVDLYVGNTYFGTEVADKEAKPGKVYEHIYFNFSEQPRTEREITLYLPLYIGVKVLSIGVDADAVINPPPPFVLSKPVVFYGTSITQGCCSSRPGVSYEAKIGRRLNLDYVNLGFAGAGNYEPALAHAVASIDASCYVLDGSNLPTWQDLNERLGPFIKIIREAHPQTPILVTSPIYYPRELTVGRARVGNWGKREVSRDVVAGLIAGGDHHIQLIDGTDLLSPAQGDGSTDGVHPNDLGIQWITDGFARRIATVLHLGSANNAD